MPHPEKHPEHNLSEHNRAIHIIDWMSSKKYSPKDYGTPELIGNTVIITRRDPRSHHGLETSSNMKISKEDLRHIEDYFESELPKLDEDKDKMAKLLRAVIVLNKVRRLLPAYEETEQILPFEPRI